MNFHHNLPSVCRSDPHTIEVSRCVHPYIPHGDKQRELCFSRRAQADARLRLYVSRAHWQSLMPCRASHEEQHVYRFPSYIRHDQRFDFASGNRADHAIIIGTTIDDRGRVIPVNLAFALYKGRRQNAIAAGAFHQSAQ